MNNKIKELREEKNMNQLRLSTLLGVSQETVSAYEKGKHYPRFTHLAKMSELFNASIDYIMGLSDIRLYTELKGLQNDEIALLSLYEKLTIVQKERVLAFMQGQLSS